MPCSVLFAAYLSFFIVAFSIFVAYTSNPVELGGSLSFDNPNQGAIFCNPNLYSCEALSIELLIDVPAWKFDIYLIAERREELGQDFKLLKSCINAHYYTLPFSQTGYEVFIFWNATETFTSLTNPIQVYCIARKATIAILTLLIIAGIVCYILLLKFCIFGVCYKRVKRWYSLRIRDREVRRRFMEL